MAGYAARTAGALYHAVKFQSEIALGSVHTTGFLLSAKEDEPWMKECTLLVLD